MLTSTDSIFNLKKGDFIVFNEEICGFSIMRNGETMYWKNLKKVYTVPEFPKKSAKDIIKMIADINGLSIRYSEEASSRTIIFYKLI